MKSWYIYQADGNPVGPIATDVLARGIVEGKVGRDAYVAAEDDTQWQQITRVHEIVTAARKLQSAPSQPQAEPPPAPMRTVPPAATPTASATAPSSVRRALKGGKLPAMTLAVSPAPPAVVSAARADEPSGAQAPHARPHRSVPPPPARPSRPWTAVAGRATPAPPAPVEPLAAPETSGLARPEPASAPADERPLPHLTIDSAVTAPSDLLETSPRPIAPSGLASQSADTSRPEPVDFPPASPDDRPLPHMTTDSAVTAASELSEKAEGVAGVEQGAQPAAEQASAPLFAEPMPPAAAQASVPLDERTLPHMTTDSAVTAASELFMTAEGGAAVLEGVQPEVVQAPAPLFSDPMQSAAVQPPAQLFPDPAVQSPAAPMPAEPAPLIGNYVQPEQASVPQSPHVQPAPGTATSPAPWPSAPAPGAPVAGHLSQEARPPQPSNTKLIVVGLVMFCLGVVVTLVLGLLGASIMLGWWR